MKRKLLTFLPLLAVLISGLSAMAANPPYEAFLGTNGILVRSNPPQGKILIDGAFITNGASAVFVTTNLFVVNNAYISNIFVTNLNVNQTLITSNLFVTTIVTTNLFVVNNTYTSNLFTTNLFVNQTLVTSNIFVTNLTVNNLFVTTQLVNTVTITSNLFVNTTITTNLFVVENTYISNLYATNIFVEQNIFTTNLYATNIFVDQSIITSNFTTINNYSSNIIVTNIFVNQTLQVSNIFVTNLVANTIISKDILWTNDNGTVRLIDQSRVGVGTNGSDAMWLLEPGTNVINALNYTTNGVLMFQVSSNGTAFSMNGFGFGNGEIRITNAVGGGLFSESPGAYIRADKGAVAVAHFDRSTNAWTTASLGGWAGGRFTNSTKSYAGAFDASYVGGHFIDSTNSKVQAYGSGFSGGTFTRSPSAIIDATDAGLYVAQFIDSPNAREDGGGATLGVVHAKESPTFNFRSSQASLASTYASAVTNGQVLAYQGSLVVGALWGNGERLVATNGSAAIGRDVSSFGSNTWSFGVHYTNAISESLGVGFGSVTSLLANVDGIRVQDIARVKGVPYSWPNAQGSSGTVLTNDGAGNLGWGAGGGGSGSFTTNFDSIRITNQVLYVAQNFNGSNGTSAVILTNNLDVHLNTWKKMTNVVGTNLVFHMSNLVESSSFIQTFYGNGGYTNTVSYRIPGGGTGTNIWWYGETNGAYDFQVSPGHSVTVNGFVDSQTNIVMAWSTTANLPKLNFYAINGWISNLFATNITFINGSISNLVATNIFIKVGGGASNAAVGGTYAVNSTPIETAGAAETNLLTHSIAGNSLTNLHDRLLIRASGRFVGNVNVKQLKLIYGTTTILDTTSQIANGGAWVIEAEIIRTGNAAQSANAVYHGTAEAVFTTASAISMAEDNGIANTIKITGTAPTTSGDITNRTLTVEYRRASP